MNAEKRREWERGGGGGGGGGGGWCEGRKTYRGRVSIHFLSKVGITSLPSADT